MLVGELESSAPSFALVLLVSRVADPIPDTMKLTTAPMMVITKAHVPIFLLVFFKNAETREMTKAIGRSIQLKTTVSVRKDTARAMTDTTNAIVPRGLRCFFTESGSRVGVGKGESVAGDFSG